MNKTILAFVLLSVCVCVFGQEEVEDNTYFEPFMISIDGGTEFSSMDIASIIVVNGGFEYRFTPVLSAQASINVWIFSRIIYGLTASLSIHFLGKSPIDPYIGLGINEMLDFLLYTQTLDVPALLGINFMFSENFGLKVQGKLFLLSLIAQSAFLVEASAGLVFAF